MSGGSYDYVCYKLSNECEGRMYDIEMNDLVKDLSEVLHDLEWWQSGDYSEDQYRETVSEFKAKWLKNELMKLIDKTYEDFKNAPGGEGWCEIDGKEYQSDMGYALEGIDMFVDVLKSRIRKPGIMSECCPWYDMCIYKTATCRVRYPDNGCVLYRWFKELVSKENEHESNSNDN